MYRLESFMASPHLVKLLHKYIINRLRHFALSNSGLSHCKKMVMCKSWIDQPMIAQG